MRVDFTSRNPYSDGAEWKWRLKDKDDHVIEGARERFGKVGKVISEDFGNIKGNVGIEMNKIKCCLVSVQARGGAIMPFAPMGRERYKSGR